MDGGRVGRWKNGVDLRFGLFNCTSSVDISRIGLWDSFLPISCFGLAALV